MKPRPELAHVPYIPHGGYHSRLPQSRLLDFSANINPAGPSPRIWDAMQAVEIARHPDPRATPLRQALAQHNGVDEAMVLVGSGSVDLIYQVALAYLRPGDRVMSLAPTFGEYAAAVAIMGATMITHPLRQSDGFALDMDALLDTIQQCRPRLCFLCNPNNPTGTYLERATVERILDAAPDTLLVLDEAFVRFVPYAWSATDLLTHGNLLILRSMTKDYALTALRVGYALAAPEMITALETVQPPWSVNGLAHAAALAALEDTAYLHTSLAQLADAKTRLLDDLAAVGLHPIPSAVHFFLLAVGDRQATAWTDWLRTHGILVRDCTSFGLPDYVRIGVRYSAENAQLVTALTACKEAQCPGVL